MKRNFKIIFPIFLFIILCNVVLAQRVNDSTKVENIAITELYSSITKSNIQKEQLMNLLKKESKYDSIEEEINLLATDIGEIKNKEKEENLISYRTHDIEIMLSRWETNKAKLDSWNKTINDKLIILDKSKKKIDYMKEQWELTRNFLLKHKAPKEVLKRVASHIISINKLQKKYKNKVSDILAFQNQITGYSVNVNNFIGLLEGLKDNFLSSIFNFKDYPLWEIYKIKIDSSHGISVFDDIKNDLEANFNYIKINFDIIFIEIIFWFFVFIVLRMIRKRAINWEIDDDRINLKNALILTNKPISTSLIFTIFIVSNYFTNSPKTLNQLIILLLVIPTIGIIRIMLANKSRKYLYFIMIIFFLLVLQDMFFMGRIFQRIFQLVLSISSISVLTFFLRSENFQSTKNRFISTIKFIIRGYVIILSVGVVFDIFGRVLISKLILFGMINSLVRGVMFYIIGLTINNAITFIIRKKDLIPLNTIKVYGNNIEKTVSAIVNLLIFYIWISALFTSFNIKKVVFASISGFFNTDILIGKISFSPFDIFSFFIVIISSWFLARMVRILIEVEIFERVRLPKSISGAISMMVRYFIVFLGFFIAAAASGIELSTLSLIAGGLGVGIGFGLQSLVNNLISGIILAFERPIQKGDSINIGKISGKVLEIGVISSKIRTWDGSEVIVPNGNVIANDLTIWSLGDRKRRITLEYFVDFGSDPEKVLFLMKEAANDNEKVELFPEPLTLFEGCSENGMKFKLLYWTVIDHLPEIKSEIAISVYEKLKSSSISEPVRLQKIIKNNDSEDKI